MWPLAIPRRRCEDNTKTDLKETDCEDVNWMEVAQIMSNGSL